MEASTTTTPRIPVTTGPRKVLHTRRGTVAIGIVTALVAGGLLFAFMSAYRKSVQGAAQTTTVLVAKRTLDAGTSGDVLAEANLFATKSVPVDEAVEGAFANVASLRGQMTATQVQEGEQLAAAVFEPGSDPITGKLHGTQRALTIPVDAAHGNIGQVEAGSRVDVLGNLEFERLGERGIPVVNVLARDVLVLSAPDEAGSGGVAGQDEQEVVLRLEDREASRVAYAADQGEVWLSIRPPTLAEDSEVDTVQLEDLPGLGALGGVGG